MKRVSPQLWNVISWRSNHLVWALWVVLGSLLASPTRAQIGDITIYNGCFNGFVVPYSSEYSPYNGRPAWDGFFSSIVLNGQTYNDVQVSIVYLLANEVFPALPGPSWVIATGGGNPAILYHPSSSADYPPATGWTQWDPDLFCASGSSTVLSIAGYDECSIVQTDRNSYGGFNESMQGQTFTPNCDGEIADVDFMLESSAANKSLTIKIKSIGSPLCNGTELYSTTIQLPGSINSFAWQKHVFSTPVNVTSGTTYFLEFTGAAAKELRLSINDEYPGGTYYTTNPTDGICQPFNIDLTFRLGITDLGSGGGPSCPTFSGAPANVSITNSTCASACTLSGGVITAPGGTPCPAGSTLQYQVNNGSWSSTLPGYVQNGPAQSIKTRCVCDTDANMTSAESVAVVTVPGTCTTPTLTGPSSVAVNAMITLTGSGTPAGSMPYTSNNMGVATVNSSGVVTGVSEGMATITYTNASGCTTTKVVTVTPAAPVCPTFSGAPANVSITNSSCASACTLSGGLITAPTGTPCPTGSTLQYQVNNGSWSSTLPGYNQSGPAQSIKTRCVCDLDANMTSAESVAAVTIPGTLANPVVPANGAATVACPSAATTPTSPAVTGCDGLAIIPTGPVTTDSPNPVTCEGTRTYTYTYTCGSTSSTWSFVYTIERNTFTVPANGAATVACLAAATAPTPPTVQSACGETLTPTGPVTTDSPNPLTCEGTRTYAYTYTDCEGNMAVWSFVYTIERDPFTVPANGAATVACLSDITVPVPPAVNSNCGEPIAPAFVSIVDGPSPLTCEGTRSYNYSYTDCEGNTLPWSFVYTIERNTFTVPANGAATVACPANATAPTPPAVLSACGETLTPTGLVTTDSPNPLTCEGTRTYAYTYTDCEGNTAVWSFVYTIERDPFTVPANGVATVACLAAATAPTAPTVTSNCGETLTPTGPVTTDSPNPLTCEGTRTYAYTYTDCEGNTAVWSFVYTIERNTFTVPANGAATVNSPALATAPALPTVTSNCGEVLTPTGPVVTNSPNPLLCAGTRTYAYTYTDCEGNTATWSFVYTVIDNTPPTISCSNAMVTFSGEATLALNVSNLASASDNCGAPTVTLSTHTVACAQVGQTVMVTATATDGAGLTASCVSQVAVAGLPCGWSQDSDGIGCGGGNNVGFTGGVFTINSTNCYSVAPYDTDEAGFAQQQLCGNGSIIARVTSLNGSGWAGVALRESDASGARKAQLLTNLGTFSRREVRYTTGGQAYPQQFASQSKYWLRILRMGDQFVGYVSANGSSWSQVFAVTITGLPSCIQAGLVVTNAQANSLVTATFSNVSITSMPTLSAIETEELGTEVVDFHLNIFPNPTSGEVTVDFTPWAGKPALLEVYDLQGRRVRRLELDEATGPMPVDMSNLPGGVYLFRVGEVQQRVVLQRP